MSTSRIEYFHSTFLPPIKSSQKQIVPPQKNKHKKVKKKKKKTKNLPNVTLTKLAKNGFSLWVNNYSTKK